MVVVNEFWSLFQKEHCTIVTKTWAMSKGSVHSSFHAFVQKNSVAILKPKWLALGVKALGRAIKEHLGSAETCMVEDKCAMKNPFGSLVGHEGVRTMWCQGYCLMLVTRKQPAQCLIQYSNM